MNVFVVTWFHFDITIWIFMVRNCWAIDQGALYGRSFPMVFGKKRGRWLFWMCLCNFHRIFKQRLPIMLPPRQWKTNQRAELKWDNWVHYFHFQPINCRVYCKKILVYLSVIVTRQRSQLNVLFKSLMFQSWRWFAEGKSSNWKNCAGFSFYWVAGKWRILRKRNAESFKAKRMLELTRCVSKRALQMFFFLAMGPRVLGRALQSVFRCSSFISRLVTFPNNPRWYPVARKLSCWVGCQQKFAFTLHSESQVKQYPWIVLVRFVCVKYRFGCVWNRFFEFDRLFRRTFSWLLY